jgi:hypothetical protein
MNRLEGRKCAIGKRREHERVGEDGHRTGRGGGGRRRAAAAASVAERVRGDAATWSGKRSALRSARREGVGLWPVGTRMAVHSDGLHSYPGRPGKPSTVGIFGW